MTGLEARYRRLLRAYPKRYRETRGLEMLTTLLDGAAAGQTRPAWQETRDLVVGGLRCRLRLPGGRGVVVLALLIAFCAATTGAIAGATLGWAASGPLPANLRTIAVVEDALDSNIASLVGYSHAATGPPTYVPEWVDATVHTRQPHTTLTVAGERFAAAGWRVRTVDGRPGFEATKRDVTLRGTLDRDTVVFSVTREQPIAVGMLALVGALFAGLAGWLLTGYGVRKALVASPGRLTIATVLTTLALVALVPIHLSYATAIVGSQWSVVPFVAPYPVANGSPFWLMPVGVVAAGTFALLAALAVVARDPIGSRYASASTSPTANK
jgi:hypothetical protein